MKTVTPFLGECSKNDDYVILLMLIYSTLPKWAKSIRNGNSKKQISPSSSLGEIDLPFHISCYYGNSSMCFHSNCLLKKHVMKTEVHE